MPTKRELKEELLTKLTKKGGDMKVQLKNGLKELMAEGKEGFQSGAGAVTADELVTLFHKHFGDKVPSWLTSLPYARDVEAAVVPALLFLVASFLDNKYSGKVASLCLTALRGKVHDLTKLLWTEVRPLFEELTSLVQD